MKLKLYMQLEYDELEKLIKKEYGHSVELVADMELSNGSYLTIKDEKRPLEGYEIKELETFKANGNMQYKAGTIFQDLCNKGILPEGNEYLVLVSW